MPSNCSHIFFECYTAIIICIPVVLSISVSATLCICTHFCFSFKLELQGHKAYSKFPCDVKFSFSLEFTSDKYIILHICPCSNYVCQKIEAEGVLHPLINLLMKLETHPHGCMTELVPQYSSNATSDHLYLADTKSLFCCNADIGYSCSYFGP